MVTRTPRSADVPTTSLYIDTVIARANCIKHDAFAGACYNIPKVSGVGYHEGVCNSRARKAGMTGHIRPASLDRSLSVLNRAL